MTSWLRRGAGRCGVLLRFVRALRAVFDFGDINEAFVQADVALVIAANDVVTPVAPTDKTRTICGMPILNADRTQNVIVIRRGKGAGHSGIGNALFFEDICRLCMARRGV